MVELKPRQVRDEDVEGHVFIPGKSSLTAQPAGAGVQRYPQHTLDGRSRRSCVDTGISSQNSSRVTGVLLTEVTITPVTREIPPLAVCLIPGHTDKGGDPGQSGTQPFRLPDGPRTGILYRTTLSSIGIPVQLAVGRWLVSQLSAQP